MTIHNLTTTYPIIAVLCGGNSPERDVSLASGAMALEALCTLGCNAYLFDPKRHSWESLSANPPSISIIMLHGDAGENGEVQAWHQLNGIRYTGSNPVSCALAMHKNYSKAIWQQAGLLVPKATTINSSLRIDAVQRAVVQKQLNYPLILKPESGGSSIDLFVVHNETDLAEAWNTCFYNSQLYLLEEYIIGEEYTVSLLANRILPIIQIQTASGLYDYHAKYQADNTQFVFDTLPQSEQNILISLARTAFTAISVDTWGRLDYIRDTHGRFYLLEANLVPGMTDHSLLPSAAAHAGISYQQVITQILAP